MLMVLFSLSNSPLTTSEKELAMTAGPVLVYPPYKLHKLNRDIKRIENEYIVFNFNQGVHADIE